VVALLGVEDHEQAGLDDDLHGHWQQQDDERRAVGVVALLKCEEHEQLLLGDDVHGNRQQQDEEL
jgi:hypothetical protein